MICTHHLFRKWVPVTTPWRVLSLRIEERLAIWRVAANILNEVTDSRQGVILQPGGLGEVLTSPHLQKIAMLRKVHNLLGHGLILWYGLSNGEGT